MADIAAAYEVGVVAAAHEVAVAAESGISQRSPQSQARGLPPTFSAPHTRSLHHAHALLIHKEVSTPL